MRYLEFIQCLFLVAGAIYLSAICYIFVSKWKVNERKRTIYRQLQKVMMFYSEKVEYEKNIPTEEFRKILKMQCKILYDCYVKNDDNMKEYFHSADDLLVKFISTIDPYQELNYLTFESEIYEPDEYNIRVIQNEMKQDDKVSNIINITGIITTIIGIVVTIISLL